MGLMAQFAGRIGVMYAGKLVEEGPVRAIFRQPAHPYTQLLMDSLPSLDRGQVLTRPRPVFLPWRRNVPAVVSFTPAVPHVMPQWLQIPPVDRLVAHEQWAACHLHDVLDRFAAKPRRMRRDGATRS